MSEPRDPGELRLADFEPLVGAAFRVEVADEAEVTLELVEAVDVSQGPTIAFSLVFSGPREQTLAQDTFAVHHEDLGRLMLFLVPIVSRPGDGQLYESIFSRLR